MNGAPKSPPAPEPAFDAAPLDDEADDASPALDLDLDEHRGRAGAAGARRGGDQGVLEARAARARRLPHDRRGRRGALCRQGALDQEAGAEPTRRRSAKSIRIARMVAADRLDGVRHHRDRGRGAAAGGQLHQAAQAALQRAAARRQELPLYPDRRRPRRAAARQASRRALESGRLFRPVRQRRRGRAHAQRAAARVPAAHLLRQLLRQPHAAVPALPDQALLGALHRRDRARRLRRAGRRRRATSSPAAAARSASGSPAR